MIFLLIPYNSCLRFDFCWGMIDFVGSRNQQTDKSITVYQASLILGGFKIWPIHMGGGGVGGGSKWTYPEVGGDLPFTCSLPCHPHPTDQNQFQSVWNPFACESYIMGFLSFVHSTLMGFWHLCSVEPPLSIFMCGMNWVHGNLIPFNRIWGMLPSTSCQVDAERPIRSIDPLGSIPGSPDMSIGFDCTFIYDDQSFSIWLRDICYCIAPRHYTFPKHKWIQCGTQTQVY